MPLNRFFEMQKLMTSVIFTIAGGHQLFCLSFCEETEEKC